MPSYAPQYFLASDASFGGMFLFPCVVIRNLDGNQLRPFLVLRMNGPASCMSFFLGFVICGCLPLRTLNSECPACLGNKRLLRFPRPPECFNPPRSLFLGRVEAFVESRPKRPLTPLSTRLRKKISISPNRFGVKADSEIVQGSSF